MYRFSKKHVAEKSGPGLLLGVTASDGSLIPANELAAIAKRVKLQYGQDMPEDQLKQLVAQEAAAQVPKYRAYYRVNATRQMTGGKQVTT